MATVEPVPLTVRNHRFRSWPVLLGLAGLATSWIGVWVVYDLLQAHMPRCNDGLIALAAGLYTIASFVVMLIVIDRRAPIRRVVLGDELWAAAVGRVSVVEIRSVRFARDPDEDYVESGLPIRVCELTVELRKRPLRLIVSIGDAARVRAWATRNGIPVRDPDGYATRGAQRHWA